MKQGRQTSQLSGKGPFVKPSIHNLSDKVFYHIQSLEQSYRSTLKQNFTDFDEIVRFRKSAHKTYARLARYVKGLIFFLRPDDVEARQALNAYQERLSLIHQRILLWTAFLCDLLLPDISSQDPDYRSFQKTRQSITEQSRELWVYLQKSADTHAWRDPKERMIFLNKDRLDRMEKNSGPWRLAYQQLCQDICLYIRTILATARFDIKGQMDHVLLEQMPADETAQAHKAADWLRGYYPPMATIQSWYQETAGRVWRSIKKSARTRQKIRMLRGVMVLALVMGCWWALQQTRLDDQIWRRIVFEVKTTFRLDHNAKEKKYKSEYFKQQIAAIDENDTLEKVRDNIRFLYDHEFEDDQAMALFFARDILKGFFLLLPNWDTEEGLKDDVLAAADSLDPRVGDILENIVLLYGQKVMKEGQLRGQLLALRRTFIAYDVFLFNFIALENDIPYLFLFSETVLRHYQLAESAWRGLGLEPARFVHSALWPEVLWVVEGEDYPFADKAGYFEGEVAVVFSRFSPNVPWTVYHEAGHVIDHLRFQYDKVPLPDNVELHAMLFPIIWANEDRKDYIASRLYHEIKKADPNDKYAQAAKGILNGFALYFKQERPDPRHKYLITNNFEEDRINNILDKILQTDTGVIKTAAYALFRDAERYLSTAQSGSYIAYNTDFREVIYGTGHTIAQRGFILGGGGIFGPRNGPRLIFDDDGDDSLGGGFNFWSFMSNVLGLILYRSENLPQSTTVESIVASVLFFVLFNAFALILHAAGTPYRKRRFYGRSLNKAARKIYDRNPWSSGYSAGREEKERQLLSRVWAAQGNIPDPLKKDLAAFKAVATDKQRFVLDVCLFLSAIHPQKCIILNKAHDLLFFIPFLGPFLGRASWIWPVQKEFHLWQRYNASVEQMLLGIQDHAGIEDLRQKLGRILEQYSNSAQIHRAEEEKIDSVFQEIKRDVRALLRQPAPMVHMSLDLLRDKMTETNEPSVEFERLETYTPGDDIRHIDWKSTARYPFADPMVRRFSSPYGARVALWLDVRGLFAEEDKQLWASDLVRSVRILHMLRGEAVLEKILVTGPDGNVKEYPVSLSTETDLVSLADRILAAGQEKFRELYAGRLPFKMQGLAFYDPEESERFMRQLRLTDFIAGSSCELRLVPLKGKRMNIFMVGAKMDQRETIHRLAGEGNRVHYW